MPTEASTVEIHAFTVRDPRAEQERCSTCGQPRYTAEHRHDFPIPFRTGPDQPPFRDGFVVGWCGHAVAPLEWGVGLRVCERCPDPPPVAEVPRYG